MCAVYRENSNIPSATQNGPGNGRGPSGGLVPSIAERPFIGECACITRQKQLALQVARTEVPILITGESGTGKEVLARFIHVHSRRAERPFIAINCAAMPDTLVESELFGHEKGAFTGAAQRKPGAFEQADTGTIFLDEVAEIEPHLQAKLLRVLQEQEVRPLGAKQAKRVDVRIIAASSRDLKEALASGALREDLYYRLRIIEICLPPLRERTEDLRLLSEHFLEKYADRDGSSLRRLSVQALDLMRAYPWPGNVRELENVIRRATALSQPEDGELLLPHHLPPEARGDSDLDGDTTADADLNLASGLQRTKHIYVTEAVRRAHGNKTEAARLLGISRRNLYSLLASIDSARG